MDRASRAAGRPPLRSACKRRKPAAAQVAPGPAQLQDPSCRLLLPGLGCLPVQVTDRRAAAAAPSATMWPLGSSMTRFATREISRLCVTTSTVLPASACARSSSRICTPVRKSSSPVHHLHDDAADLEPTTHVIQINPGPRRPGLRVRHWCGWLAHLPLQIATACLALPETTCQGPPVPAAPDQRHQFTPGSANGPDMRVLWPGGHPAGRVAGWEHDEPCCLENLGRGLSGGQRSCRWPSAAARRPCPRLGHDADALAH